MQATLRVSTRSERTPNAGTQSWKFEEFVRWPRKTITSLKARPKRKVTDSFKRSHEKRKEWLKQGTFECAAILLEGRDAHVTAYGVRKSYKKMEKSLRDPSNAIGAWFDDPFLMKLGLQGVHGRKPGTNTFLFLPSRSGT
jgi:hypothetical protein